MAACNLEFVHLGITVEVGCFHVPVFLVMLEFSVNAGWCFDVSGLTLI